MISAAAHNLRLTGGAGEDIYVLVGRMRIITAVVMAYVVMVILVSPAVPSPATMLRSKHTLQPPQFVAPVAALLFTAAANHAQAFQWMVGSQPTHPVISGAEVVDLTSARLC